MQKLLDNISSNAQVDLQITELVQAFFSHERIPKNTTLVKNNQIANKLYFMDKGLARTFYYQNDKDVTSWFYFSGFFFTCWYSFYSQKRSFEFLETLEDCVIYSISFRDYQQLLQAHPQLQHFGRRMAEQQLAYIDHFSKGYMYMTAKEKYELLLQIFPEALLRVKLGHIASFLGITQETLSRIRSQK